MGDTKGGAFDVAGDQAREWLRLPANPNGRTNADVLKPWVNGMDLTRRPAGKWIVDFGLDMSVGDAALYEEPFRWVKEHVWPTWDKQREAERRTQWWLHHRPRPNMWAALWNWQGCQCPPWSRCCKRRQRVAKGTALAVLHVWLPQTVAPDRVPTSSRGHPAGVVGWRGRACAGITTVSANGCQSCRGRAWRRMAADGDGWLPGFAPGLGTAGETPGERTSCIAGGLEAFQRGRGAPWPLRIAYETLIDVPAAARNGWIARLEYPLRGDGDATLQAMLYPEGRLNLSRDWGRFLEALDGRGSSLGSRPVAECRPGCRSACGRVPVRTERRVAPRRIRSGRFGQGTAHLEDACCDGSARVPIRSGGRGWRWPTCGTVRPSTVTGCGQPGRAWRGIPGARLV